MNWLLKNYMKKDTFVYIFAVILDVIGGLVSFILPVALIGKIVDIGIVGHDYNEMIRLLILSISLCVVGNLMAYFGVIMIDSKTFNMNSRLGVELSKKVFYFDHNYFENTTVGELNTLLGKDLRNINRVIAYDVK